MRITFLLPEASLAGGVRAVAIYAEKLQQRGHEVLVISKPHKPRGLRRTIKDFLGHGVVKPRTLPSHLDDKRVTHRVLEARRSVTELDVPDGDVLVATWWETAEQVARMPPSKGKKVHFIQHDERVFDQPADRVAATWSLPMYRIVVAGWLADLARNEFGIEQADVVPCGVDTAQFSAGPRVKAAVPTVGVMYSRVHFKGCDVALEAVRLAQKQVPGLKLLAFGDHPEVPELPLPANATLQVAPPQESIREIYAACDAWLFCSRCEGFGLPLLEAMACRTPTIATPTGVAPDLYAQGGCLKTAMEDPADTAQKILEVAAMDRTAWQTLSEQAAATARGYDWNLGADAFEAALLRAVSAG
ncbi:MAG: glycosyltransferase family 4 protein [Phycisphaerae bacterium]